MARILVVDDSPTETHQMVNTLARQGHHDGRLSKLPIVMISSRTGEKHKEHASELGVDKFLGKPFQENELLATIDELVSGS